MNWPVGPDCPVLEAGAVHVWRIGLSLDEDSIAALEATLSTDERSRADRFRFPELRSKFIVAHGALRDILARYLRMTPAGLVFAISPHGKPSISGVPLRFNLSHSGDLALVAVTTGGEIGVDIEWFRPGIERDRIAERFFSAREAAALRALPAAARTEAFFNCWTRKEAFIKAVGDGLSYPLDAFEVTLAPGEPPAVLSVRGDAVEAARWRMNTPAPGPGYAAAVALEGEISKVSYWEWLAPGRRNDQHGRARR